MKTKYKDFSKKIGEENILFDEPMARYTTVGIGGPADMLVVANNSRDLESLIKAAQEFEVPVTVFGGGSNILVADEGIRGLVVIARGGDYEIQGKREVKKSKDDSPDARWGLDGQTARYLFEDLDYDETDLDTVRVVVDAGINVQQFMYNVFDEGLTGLQWYSGIPGTFGGGVFNNVHGGTHFISEVVNFVEVLTPRGETRRYKVDEINPDYNWTIFHENNDYILRVGLDLYLGDPKKAKYVADEWRARKHKVQPQKSTGCVFANISSELKEEMGFPTTSVGYIIERELCMTDFRLGNVLISPKHHNFIVADGEACASDYVKIIKEITQRAKEEFDIDLVCEIMFHGFEDSELEGINRPRA